MDAVPSYSCRRERGHTAVDRINGTIGMSRKAPRLALRESQTACLVALRHRKCSTPRLAVEAKLDIKKTAAALRTLRQLGLAEREGTRDMAAATARIVGATARSMGEMSMPARLNMPPFAPKSFSMSITSTAHLPEVDTNRFRFCLYGDYTALVAHGRPFLTRPPTDSGAVFSPDVPHCAWEPSV